MQRRLDRSRGWARAWGVLAAIALAVWPSVAAGAPFELSWSAPPGCPSREAIVSATRARLHDGDSELPPELFVEGTVSEENGGFVVSLVMHDASAHPAGARRLRVEERECKAIEKSTALVLAMMIAVARESPHVDDGTDQASIPPAVIEPTISSPPPPVVDARPRVAAPSKAPPRLVLGAAGIASTGVLPNVGFGLSIRGAVAWRRLILGLEASLEDGGTVRAAGGDVGFMLYAATARAGFTVVDVSRFTLAPTLGATLGLLRSSASGFAASYDEGLPTLLLGVGAVARYHLGDSVFLDLLPEVDGVLVRDRFSLRGAGKLYLVHRPSAIAARMSLGVGYEF